MLNPVPQAGEEGQYSPVEDVEPLMSCRSVLVGAWSSSGSSRFSRSRRSSSGSSSSSSSSIYISFEDL